MERKFQENQSSQAETMVLMARLKGKPRKHDPIAYFGGSRKLATGRIRRHAIASLKSNSFKICEGRVAAPDVSQ